MPRLNARVNGREIDALFEAEKLIVELGGWEFHQDRASFETDRERDADATAIGYATVRITADRLTDREATRLHTILAARRKQSGIE